MFPKLVHNILAGKTPFPRFGRNRKRSRERAQGNGHGAGHRARGQGNGHRADLNRAEKTPKSGEQSGGARGRLWGPPRWGLFNRDKKTPADSKILTEGRRH